MNMKVYVMFLLIIWMKRKMIFFKHERKTKLTFFINNKSKFNLEPRT